LLSSDSGIENEVPAKNCGKLTQAMSNTLKTIGWREWVTLPELGLPRLKAKIDTGARTSCLHAFSINEFSKQNQCWVRFGIHPNQDDLQTEFFCEAAVRDRRPVTDSGGHTEERYVIVTPIELAGQRWPIEITLTNRDTMRFRMLLGRTAMLNHFVVNPALSFTSGKPQL
jgi:hypothetical protein